MVWARYTSRDTGALHIIDAKMDGAMYRQTLVGEGAFSKKRKRTFQQDNDPKDTAN